MNSEYQFTKMYRQPLAMMSLLKTVSCAFYKPRELAHEVLCKDWISSTQPEKVTKNRTRLKEHKDRCSSIPELPAQRFPPHSSWTRETASSHPPEISSDNFHPLEMGLALQLEFRINELVCHASLISHEADKIILHSLVSPQGPS